MRVVEISFGDLPVLTLQDPSDVQGAVVFDCRPPLLPVSLDLSGMGLLSGLPPAASASVGVWECLPMNMAYRSVGGNSDGLVIPELGFAALEDSGTNLEDELPMMDGLPSTDASKPVLGPTSPGVDLELTRALHELSVLQAMVTPIDDRWWGHLRRQRCTPSLRFRCCRWWTRLLFWWPLLFDRWGEPSSGSIPVVPGIASWLHV